MADVPAGQDNRVFIMPEDTLEPVPGRLLRPEQDEEEDEGEDEDEGV